MWIVRIISRRIGFGIRIDEHEQMAASHDELIDGVLHVIAEILRMHDDQDTDVLVDRFHGRGIELADLERLAQLLIDRPRLAHRTRLRIEALRDRQAADQSDDGFLRLIEFVDQLRDVVFEERFLLRVEKWNRRFAVGRIGAGETEEDLVAAAIGRNGGEPERGRAVFVLGERQRIDHFEIDLAAGAAGHLLEQFAHTRRVGADLRQILRAFVGIKVIQMNRLVDVREDVLRTLRQSIQMALREIDARAAEQNVADQQYRNEQHGKNGERAAGEKFLVLHVSLLFSNR